MRTYEERIELFSSFLKPHLRERNFDALYQWCVENEFFSQAASTKYHGNYPGGLFDHSYNVAETLVRLTESNACIRWERPESPYIIGMFHDLCKTDQYRHTVASRSTDGQPIGYNPSEWEYNTDTLLKGHGDKSVMILAALLPLTEEEVMCIRYHMGAFTDKEEWQDYTRAIHRYPNVLWTHQADMLASHVAGV